MSVTKEVLGNRQVLTPFEDNCDLQAIVDYQMPVRASALFLKNRYQPGYKFVFAFTASGFHPTPTVKVMNGCYQKFENGLKDIPEGETVTFRFASFREDTRGQAVLDQLLASPLEPSVEFYVRSAKKHLQGLTARGLRREPSLEVFVTYTIQDLEDKPTDMIEGFLRRIEKLSVKLSGREAEQRRVLYHEMALRAYYEGFQKYLVWFDRGLGYPLLPLSVSQLWGNLFRRFSVGEVPALPVVWKVTESGSEEVVQGDLHPTTMLLRDGVPVPSRSYVYVPGRNQYVASLVFASKPSGWSSLYDLMRYIWKLCSLTDDVEYVCQISRGDSTLATEFARLYRKQSETALMKAGTMGTTDVGAKLNIQTAEETEMLLLSGDIPVHCAAIFNVYRRQPEDLKIACRLLSSSVPRPAELWREQEVSWKVWLDTLHLSVHKMLTLPFRRTLMFFGSEVIGLLPLLFLQSPDRAGVEFVTEEGSYPFYVDMFNQKQPHHMAVFGKTRSGKSVLVVGFLFDALSRGVKVTVIDRADVGSTFKDMVFCLSEDGRYASFIDVAKVNLNPFELPRFRTLSPEQAVNNLNEYKDYLGEFLLSCCRVSSGSTSAVELSIRTVIRLALRRFFEDPEIQSRYDYCADLDITDLGWQKYPTIVDFIQFLDPVLLGIDGGEVLEALRVTKLRLMELLAGKFGACISKPSTVRSTADLTVYTTSNVTSEVDASNFANLALIAAIRNSVDSPVSCVFVDEASVQLKNPAFAAMWGRLHATGAKSGIRCITASQDAAAIEACAARDQILQNLDMIFVGRIVPTAVVDMANTLRYPKELVARCATDGFFPDRVNRFTHWLYYTVDMNNFTYLNYSPCPAVISSCANNTDERAKRQEYFDKYPDDRLRAWYEYMRDFFGG